MSKRYMLIVGLKDENRRLSAANENLSREKQSLAESSKTLSDATYRFFEARVAVMGFKCRTMQLQGELDELVSDDGSYPTHMHTMFMYIGNWGSFRKYYF